MSNFHVYKSSNLNVLSRDEIYKFVKDFRFFLLENWIILERLNYSTYKYTSASIDRSGTTPFQDNILIIMSPLIFLFPI